MRTDLRMGRMRIPKTLAVSLMSGFVKEQSNSKINTSRGPAGVAYIINLRVTAFHQSSPVYFITLHQSTASTAQMKRLRHLATAEQVPVNFLEDYVQTT